mgnify:CR=1 FL=1
MMWRRSSGLAAAVCVAAGCWGQGMPFRVELPAGSAVDLVSAEWGNSSAVPRGGAMLVDLHASLVLRNNTPRRIRAIALRVVAQEVTPGGRGAVTRPGLDVAPREEFPVRIDMRLMRPLAAQGGPLVEVSLDGVLFDDLTFSGPNRMNVRRTMLAWEMEARRDRQALASLLGSGGEEAVRARLLEVLARRQAGAMMPVQVVRGAAPATAVEPGRQVELAALQLPDAPVEVLAGQAQVAGAEVRAPRVEVANRSRRGVRFVELGWLAPDGSGRLLPAGTLPSEIHLPPGQRLTVRTDTRVRFTRTVDALAVYPALVEFDDGGVWVPGAAAWAQPNLRDALPISGEMVRLAELYRKRGLEAVIQQLRAMR